MFNNLLTKSWTNAFTFFHLWNTSVFCKFSKLAGCRVGNSLR
jgi:hypothetical protein